MFSDWAAIGVMCTIIGAILTAAMYQARQFTSLRNFIYDRTDSLKKYFNDKIDYHEQHDDKRFSQLNDSIWLLRLRNASKDGFVPNSKEIAELVHKDENQNPL